MNHLDADDLFDLVNEADDMADLFGQVDRVKLVQAGRLGDTTEEAERFALQLEVFSVLQRLGVKRPSVSIVRAVAARCEASVSAADAVRRDAEWRAGDRVLEMAQAVVARASRV